MVRNNIFAFGRDQQLQATRIEKHRSFTFEGNIVYWKKGNLLAGNFLKMDIAMDRNVYWQEESEDIRFAGLTLEKWRALGRDVHSIIADPQFNDPTRNDFKLGERSPALKLGFIPFDLSKVGPRK